MEGGAEPQARGVTAGRLLAQLREAAGLHVATLASMLKVPVARLEALEEDRYDTFPDTVFLRAVAASACRALKADPAPVLALLPGGQPAQLRVGEGINATFRDSVPRGGLGGPASGAPRSRTLVVAVVGLLLAAVAVALWPVRDDGRNPLMDWLPSAGNEEADVARPVPAPSNPPEQQAEPQAAAPAAQAPAPPVTGTDTPPTPAAPGAQPPAATVAATPAPAVTTASGATLAQAPVETLVLRARAPSWVQVRAAGGAVVLQKILAEGESAPVPGTPPWSVVIGKADATEVLVRGAPLDLKPLTRDNVARFEVK